MKYICDVRQVADLAEGETAPPEPDMGYELRSIAGDNFETGLVEYVVRRGDAILAQTAFRSRRIGRRNEQRSQLGIQP